MFIFAGSLSPLLIEEAFNAISHIRRARVYNMASGYSSKPTRKAFNKSCYDGCIIKTVRQDSYAVSSKIVRNHTQLSTRYRQAIQSADSPRSNEIQKIN